MGAKQSVLHNQLEHRAMQRWAHRQNLDDLDHAERMQNYLSGERAAGLPDYRDRRKSDPIDIPSARKKRLS